MPEPFNPAILQPGDAILYFKNSFFGWMIALKTWTKVAHVEIYRGNNTSFASRDGLGVDQYRLRLDGVAAILRPKTSLDFATADLWFQSYAKGQPYDWLGLLCFTLTRRRGEKNKMFCSEFATRYYRKAGLVPFNPQWHADRVPPSFFLVSPAFYVLWTDGNLF